MFLTINEEKLEEEIVEKKSRFIGTMFYVESEEKAQEILKEIKKQYYDARHNCFAYRIMTENGVVERFSDDGEPSGTAGGPMLNILTKNNLCNVLVVVTRYFGGILLGTGGLVRAYSDATTKVIESATIANETIGLEVEIEIEYTMLEMFKYYCKKNDINIVDIVYENNIKCYIEVTDVELENLLDINKNNCKIVGHKVIRTKNIRKKTSEK
ncbi:MAG: YigZ family protein [Clostridia bacterium]|nr:YigZ family protein [Clostridia bacterium]